MFEFAYTRYQRIHRYLDTLKNAAELKNESEISLTEELHTLVDDRIKRLKRLSVVSFFFYFGIYISFVSVVASNFLILSKVALVVSYLVGVTGTTIFFVGIYLTTTFRDLYYQDLQLFTSHLIAIYESNSKNLSSILETTKDYHAFLEFFKKRGF